MTLKRRPFKNLMSDLGVQRRSVQTIIGDTKVNLCVRLRVRYRFA